MRSICRILTQILFVFVLYIFPALLLAPIYVTLIMSFSADSCQTRGTIITL
jgi:ABC-type spermidine/putrescine transport system permease subunit II